MSIYSTFDSKWNACLLFFRVPYFVDTTPVFSFQKPTAYTFQRLDTVGRRNLADRKKSRTAATPVNRTSGAEVSFSRFRRPIARWKRKPCDFHATDPTAGACTRPVGITVEPSDSAAAVVPG